MAYVTGTANNLAELLTALRNACVANGWTLSGNVLHKGTCFVETSIGSSGGNIEGFTAPSDNALRVLAGNGKDGSNLLTDPAPKHGAMAKMAGAYPATTYPDWDWPVTYHCHVHTAPDEVYFIVNYGAGLFWQWVAFGQSPMPDCPGTGNWHSATMAVSHSSSWHRRVDECFCGASGSNIAGSTAGTGATYPAAPFWVVDNRGGNINNSHFHGCFDLVSGAAAWTNPDNSWLYQPATGVSYEQGIVSAALGMRPLLSYTPNAWNAQTVLLPMLIYQRRLEEKSSLVGRLSHMRMCRNDYIDPGQIITIGPDKWKVYPCYRKSLTNRDGLSSVDHSGTVAMAIRYDGP